MAETTEFKFDVALSFAGENRSYVEQVAAYLRERSIKVFYDDFEKIELWGKDLYEHFSLIYNSQSQFVVMFISEHYAEKAWTNHERRSAQARALKEKAEYILPARFDSTPVPGLLETTYYIDISNMPPVNFARLVEQKVGQAGFWQRQAVAAAIYVGDHKHPAHRGALLWAQDLVAVFANDGIQLDHVYIERFVKKLRGEPVLASARSPDDYSLVLLFRGNDAAPYHDAVWAAFEEEYLRGGGRASFVVTQRAQADKQLYSHFRLPVVRG